jgi:hypothetical protein
VVYGTCKSLSSYYIKVPIVSIPSASAVDSDHVPPEDLEYR